jgi:hypothetical protein
MDIILGGRPAMGLIEGIETDFSRMRQSPAEIRRLSAERLGEIRAAALSYMTTKPEGEILARMWLYLASCGPSEAIAMVDEILRHRSQAAARMAGCGTPAPSDPARPAP